MKFHLYATEFWIAMIPVSIVTGWINSVAYVSALSLWALVGAHWSAWQAARVEVRQEEQVSQVTHCHPCTCSVAWEPNEGVEWFL